MHHVMDLENEYGRCLRSLERTGVLILLPDDKGLGVIGKDGGEYPVPTMDQLMELSTRNEELVDMKVRQGFTQLLLTPMALSVHHLVERVGHTVIEHDEAGNVLRTKVEPTEADVPTDPNTDDPVWIWDAVFQAVDTDEMVYFPRSYDPSDHRGLTKADVLRDPSYCAVPGWSVGLIEPIPIMPRRGKGKVIGKRKQLEEYSTPTGYMEVLRTSPYRGETGWTLEDFLTHFMMHLEETGEVSHDRSDGNSLWMLGMFLPRSVPDALIVPTGNWASDAGRRMYIGAHRTNNRIRAWVARSVVRLVG